MLNFINNLSFSLDINASRNAFCINDTYYTYEVLNQHINKITNELIELDKGRVAIFCENNVETYAAILSCWTLGFSYVPILKKNPVNRNLDILVDAGISNILCSDTRGLDDNYVNQFNLIDVSSFNQVSVSKVHPRIISGEMEAYVLFTSGSTGKPKGVPISFANLQYFLDSFEDSGFEIKQDDRCLQMFELTFDVSISSFLPSLLAGACTYTISDTKTKYLDVYRLISKYKLTSIQIVPSVLKLGENLFSRVDFSSLKNCYLVGEATDASILQCFWNSAPNIRVFNYYGPTECTIFCSSMEVYADEIKSYNGLVAIGKPFANSTFIICDETGEILHENASGELWISSPQLTKGYIDDKLNYSAFKYFNNLLFYKTGDVCVRDVEGHYLFCGRIDNQIKIQGFRVELGEIEFKVREKFRLNCIAITNIDTNGFTQIDIILEFENSDIVTEVKDFLYFTIPSYMFPRNYYVLKKFPLTQNGKIDRVSIKNLVSE